MTYVFATQHEPHSRQFRLRSDRSAGCSASAASRLNVLLRQILASCRLLSGGSPKNPTRYAYSNTSTAERATTSLPRATQWNEIPVQVRSQSPRPSTLTSIASTQASNIRAVGAALALVTSGGSSALTLYPGPSASHVFATSRKEPSRSRAAFLPKYLRTNSVPAWAIIPVKYRAGAGGGNSSEDNGTDPVSVSHVRRNYADVVATGLRHSVALLAGEKFNRVASHPLHVGGAG